MAVRTLYTAAYPDPALKRRPRAINADAGEINISGQMPILFDDSIGTKIYLGRLPSGCIIDPRSILYHTGITSATLNIGFEPTNGQAATPTALASALALSSAGTKQINAGVTVPNLMKAVWELAGFTSDPGMDIPVVATLAAAATVAGNVAWLLSALRE